MDEIKRVGRKLMYHGVVINAYRDTMLMPNGNTEEWDFIQHHGAAAVVAVMDDGRIIMVRQHRPAIGRFTLELPAGKLDFKGESKADCAARELEEETGYKAGKLELLVTVDTTVAICDEEIEIYLATELMKTEQHLDEDEDINVEAYDVDELMGMIARQEIRDSKTVAGILAYKAFRQS